MRKIFRLYMMSAIIVNIGVIIAQLDNALDFLTWQQLDAVGMVVGAATNIGGWLLIILAVIAAVKKFRERRMKGYLTKSVMYLL